MKWSFSLHNFVHSNTQDTINKNQNVCILKYLRLGIKKVEASLQTFYYSANISIQIETDKCMFMGKKMSSFSSYEFICGYLCSI